MDPTDDEVTATEEEPTTSDEEFIDDDMELDDEERELAAELLAEFKAHLLGRQSCKSATSYTSSVVSPPASPPPPLARHTSTIHSTSPASWATTRRT